MNRSALFVAYNAARNAAHAGFLEIGRVNRSLGLAQRKEPRPYQTTIDACDCPDSKYRPATTCKHRLALLLKEKANAIPESR